MTTTVRIVRHAELDWPQQYELLEAYTIFPAPGVAEVHIRHPFDVEDLAVERAWHELEHALDRSFTNATHHPWWHFCLRGVPPAGLRFDYHNQVATRDEARKLLATGVVVA